MGKKGSLYEGFTIELTQKTSFSPESQAQMAFTIFYLNLTLILLTSY